MKKAVVRPDSYFDSVFLMSLSAELKGRPGIRDAVVAMGTAMNLELLSSLGYAGDELARARPADLVMAVDCEDEGAVAAALDAAAAMIGGKGPRAAAGSAAGADAGAREAPRSLGSALSLMPDANIAIISVPGAYAAREAMLALERGLHVMLFSDNVSLEDEIALKRFGTARGLLVMGPDCGTSILGGLPLCFANAVRRGPVGIVAASGTGLQEVSCLVDRLGSGVSQAVGTGGRDLKDERVGGMTALAAIRALAADPETRAIALVSKPPAPSVAAKVMAALGDSGKPCVAHFVGLDPARAPGPPPSVRLAASLEEAAVLAAAAAGGSAAGAPPAPFGPEAAEMAAIASAEAARLSPGQRFVRGYYTGGTLADEAMFLLHRATGAVRSNNQTDPSFLMADPRVSEGHAIVDLGDDVFTRGRPHPMIDPSARAERMLAESGDPTIAVVLVDVVLGYGSHADPAGALVPAIEAMRAAARARGGWLPVVASVVGVRGDPQGLEGQVAKLRAAGCLVMPSNFRAAGLAALILAGAPSAGGEK